jgi:apolipoprotein N-acyltransferase
MQGFDTRVAARRATQPAVLPLLPAVVVAAGAGLLLDTAFPDKGWWFTAFPAIGLALIAMQGRRVGGAILIGLVFGGTFYWPHIEWASEFLGLVPWSALAAVMTLWNGAAAALIALAYRWLPRVWNGLGGRLLLLPLVVAGIWTAREAAASVWPYGGFSWGRVAFSQSDSPLSPLFAWIGASGVSFVMVFLVALALAAVQEAIRHPHRWAALGALVTLAALVLVSVPAWTSLPGTAPSAAPTLRVGAVQGDTKAGYFDPPENFGDNLLGQVAATEPLYDEDVDVVVWPEGASDASPLAYSWARELWDEVVERAGAPLVGGTITTRQLDKVDENGDPMPEYFNTVMLWEAGAGSDGHGGPTDYYDKKHPVPFGEYVPDRAFWRQFAPDLIDLIQREYTPGTTDAVFRLPGSGAIVGNAICFDIVDDQLLREMVDQGAQVVFAETNNADFGRTDESVQQLAIARIRAIETARTVVNVSTVGTSAIVLPDGTIEQQLPWYEPGVMVADVPLLTTVTPAVLVGRQFEWLVSILGLGGLLIAGLAARTGRRA